jgi:hypothetical protein
MTTDLSQVIESAVQNAVKEIFQLYGADIYDLSQGYRPGGKRHGTTRQSKGLADLYVFFPRWQTAIWFEVKKRPDEWPLNGVESSVRREFYRKVQTDHQMVFETHCAACGVRYLLGGLEEALEYVTEMRAHG